MECSICFNAITSATGKVELSCSHPFHFSCLTTWFDKQRMQGCDQNCPLCRHESNEFEKMPAVDNDDEEEDDDETWDYDDDEEDEEEQQAAQERAKALFDKLKLINPIEEVQLYAANKIKACWRGYQDRLLHFDLLANKGEIEYQEERITKAQEKLNEQVKRVKFLKAIIGLSRVQVKRFASTKIQAFWRRHKVEAAIGTMSGLWRKIRPGSWEKVVMNPEEHEPEIVSQLPSTLV